MNATPYYEPTQLVAVNGVLLTTEDTPPKQGGWAQVIAGLRWNKAHKGMVLKSDFLDYLNQMEVIREPIWRHEDQFLGEMIGRALSRIEACRMQISGNLAPNPCKNCLKGHGRFSQCVEVKGFPGVTGCANCQWSLRAGAASRCEWPVAEIRPLQTTLVAENIVMGEAALPAQEQNSFAMTSQAFLPVGQAAIQQGTPLTTIHQVARAGPARFRPRNTIQRDIDRLMAKITQEVSRQTPGLIRRVRAHDMELALPPVYDNLDDEGPEHEAQDADEDDEDDEDFDDEGESGSDSELYDDE